MLSVTRRPSGSSSSSEALPSAKRQKPENGSPTQPVTSEQSYAPSIGERLLAFRRWAARSESEEGWPAQLLAILQQVTTVQDVNDWLNALTPALCRSCPALLSSFSERLSCLLPQWTPDSLHACVERCLNVAAGAGQSVVVWRTLCAALPSMSLTAMQALLECLQGQENPPANGAGLIVHIKEVIDLSLSLPASGFGTGPGTTLVVPIELPPVVLGEDEIMAIDTGTDRHAIQAPGTTTRALPELNHDVLTLVMAHALRAKGIDWMQPQHFGPYEKHGKALLNMALVDKQFLIRFQPMLANHPWMKREADSRLKSFSDIEPADAMSRLIHDIVDLDAQTVKSMLPGAPGVAQRRLDLVLRALSLCLTQPRLQISLPLLQGVYSQLHNRAVVQLASAGQAVSPSFAQHVDLSAMPLQLLTTAYRMLGGTTPAFRVLTRLTLEGLQAYPEDVQVQTLIGVLPFLGNSQELVDKFLGRIQKLMDNGVHWKRPAHDWLLYQASRLNVMLALIDGSSPVLEEEANGLLAALQRHHGVGGEPRMLIDDPFGERYVLWTMGDIGWLCALCKRAEKLEGWNPSGLVHCLADLLRQFCSVSAPAYRFAAPQFMALFPASILSLAFARLTFKEQSLMLCRIYAPDDQKNRSDHMELIASFAGNGDIPVDDRVFVLEIIKGFTGQHFDCIDLVDRLMKEMPHKMTDDEMTDETPQ
ncbi:hypothetical protein [Variovorax soli]|nr:hypothetical protein [Variovorax soli]